MLGLISRDIPHSGALNSPLHFRVSTRETQNTLGKTTVPSMQSGHRLSVMMPGSPCSTGNTLLCLSALLGPGDQDTH